MDTKFKDVLTPSEEVSDRTSCSKSKKEKKEKKVKVEKEETKVKVEKRAKKEKKERKGGKEMAENKVECHCCCHHDNNHHYQFYPPRKLEPSGSSTLPYLNQMCVNSKMAKNVNFIITPCYPSSTQALVPCTL